MVRRFLLPVLAVILTVALVMTACDPALPTPDPRTDTGAWVDEVIITVEGSPGAAVSKLEAGDIEIYGMGIRTPELVERIFDNPALDYQLVGGSTGAYILNPAGPTFAETGKLNPFYYPRIREALQWLIDRHYIVDEFLSGAGIPKYTQLAPLGPEQQDRYPDILDAVEAYYAHDPAKAESVISEEMLAAGATLVDGKWHYDGEPVEIICLIRSDLYPPLYPPAGHYLADLLEDVGFTTVRLLRTASEAHPLWLFGSPDAGTWHFYTAGWGLPSIFREEVQSWAQFNTHLVMSWSPLYASLEPLMADWPDLYEGARRLQQKEFTTLDERRELVETTVWEARKFANDIWFAEITDVYPYRANVDLVLDDVAGLGFMWAQTIHYHTGGTPVRGGTVRMEVPDLLIGAWNPVEGSPYSYDISITREALGDRAIAPDPTTGLYWPQRIDRVELTLKSGLPVEKSHDYVTLDFADEINVPLTAWADWDAAEQRFVTVAERMDYDDDYEPTALRKCVVYYPNDLWDFPLHDGSTLSMADFMMSMIMSFDRGKEASPIYDPAEKSLVEAELKQLKGWEIISENPLTIATYSDYWTLDAEWMITTWWPGYGTYLEFAPWHAVAIGMLAEMDNQLTFSSAKAGDLNVDQMDYTRGPSLPILKGYLDQAYADKYMPYEPTMKDYMNQLAVELRYESLQDWYDEHRHFWVGCGPFYLEAAYGVEKIIHLKRFEDYPDLSNRWMRFV